MLSKKTCEGVDLIVKLPAISLQACKFIEKKNIFEGFQLDFKLFIVLFLGIISWKGASRFNAPPAPPPSPLSFQFLVGFIFKCGEGGAFFTKNW